MKSFIKTFVLIFLAIIIANIIIEFTFEQSLENITPIKFFLSSMLVSLICSFLFQKLKTVETNDS